MKYIEPKLYALPIRGASPWPLHDRIRILLWSILWPLFCEWTPKPLNSWRLMWLRMFGCKIDGNPFVHQRARIPMPWHLTLGEGCSVGDQANLYCLGEIKLGPKCVIAQEAYLCTGTHDFTDPSMALITARIEVGTDAFVAARAFVMPGVCIGAQAVVGACSVVTEDVPPGAIVAGSPARFLRFREAALLEAH